MEKKIVKAQLGSPMLVNLWAMASDTSEKPTGKAKGRIRCESEGKTVEE
ncbi:MAG: hypothetical protein R2877_06585 [Bdellovibrionota bacterium]